jgi:hypothetical protein
MSVPFPEFGPGSDVKLAGSLSRHIALRRPVLEVRPDAWRHVREELHEPRAAQSFSGEFRLSPMTLKRFLCDAKVNETKLWRPALAHFVIETGYENRHVVAAHCGRNAGAPSNSDNVWWDSLTSEAG